MPPSVAELPVEQLSVNERLTLLGRLWDSLLDEGTPPIQPWHMEVVRRRIAAADAAPDASIPLDELRRELKGAPS